MKLSPKARQRKQKKTDTKRGRKPKNNRIPDFSFPAIQFGNIIIGSAISALFAETAARIDGNRVVKAIVLRQDGRIIREHFSFSAETAASAIEKAYIIFMHTHTGEWIKVSFVTYRGFKSYWNKNYLTI